MINLETAKAVKAAEKIKHVSYLPSIVDIVVAGKLRAQKIQRETEELLKKRATV